MTARLIGALSLTLIAFPVSGETVEKLTKANFDARIKSDIILVKFYAPWCGHCKAMAPAYEEAAQKLAKHSPPIPLANVDATVEPEITQKQGVQGYPTLKIFRKGVASDYGGGRDAAGIVAYMLKEAGSAPAAVSSDNHVSPMLMAKLCQDQTCTDENFPLIDYDENENKCVCAAHPCWDDNGKAHHCKPDGEHPHLTFSYTKAGVLECGCRKEPHHVSKYIAQVKCAGEHCDDPENPVLDYVPEEKKCVCRPHPCNDVGGVKHECSNPKFPILNYREEKTPEGGVKQLCECKAGFHKKGDEEL